VLPTGVKVSDKELAALPLRPHEFHGEWNYTIAQSVVAPAELRSALHVIDRAIAEYVTNPRLGSGQQPETCHNVPGWFPPVELDGLLRQRRLVGRSQLPTL
jgi:hypothetical protein